MPEPTPSSRRVLVGSWLGSTNLGDELLFRALERRLRPYADAVTAISLDPSATRRRHGVAAVGHRDVRGLVRAAGATDAFVFGGGDLIQDITSPFNLPYHLSRVALARARRLPVAGVGLGIPPLSRRWSPALVRTLWPRSAPMAVRDQGSQEVARGLGVDAVLAADLVFGLDPPDVPAEDAIVVCLRPWHGGGRRRAAASWEQGFDPTMLSALAAALDDLATRTGLPIRFLAFQPDRDGPFHDAVAARIAKAPVSVVAADLDVLLGSVAASRLVVSARYHGAVAGILAGRPVVALSYADKVARLAADAPDSVTGHDLSVPGVAGLAVTGEALLARAPDVAADRDRLREREAGNGVVLDQILA